MRGRGASGPLAGHGRWWILVWCLLGLGVLATSAAAAISASFTCSPSCSVAPGATVMFSSTSSSSAEITDHEWDLDGDGSYGADDEPDEPNGRTTNTAQRAFAAAGTYQVGLRVTNRDGDQSTARRTVIVAVPPTPPPTELPPLPDALPPPAGSDLDRDRLPLRRDACPGTPRGKRPLWRGCAAADLVRGARLVSNPVLVQLKDAGRLFGRERGFGRPRKRIKRARRLIGSATQALEHGKPCRAKSAYEGALSQLSRARLELRRGFLVKRRRVARRLKPAADVSPSAMGVALLGLKRALAGDALAAARRARGAFARPCRALGRGFKLRARVLGTNDAAGTLRLTGGKLLVLHEGIRRRGPVAEGAMVRARGLRFKDGTGLVGSLTAASGQGPPGLMKIPCLKLRIAPPQPFPPWVPFAPTVRHDPAGYRVQGGTHVLEQLTRLTVVKQGPCIGSAPGGKTLRYSAHIEESVGLVSEDLALDLEAGETVPVGAVVATGSTGKLRATTYVEACKQLVNGKIICDPPAKHSTEEIKFTLRAHRSLATAKYASTSFGTKDNDLSGDTDDGHVTGLGLAPLAQAATGFQASGYQLENGKSSRPATRLVELGEPFLIYADDIYDDEKPGTLFPLNTYGVDESSGLIWPRVVGKRNGKPFWYSAKLPSIVRDRTPAGSCPKFGPFTQPKGPPDPNPKDADGFYPPAAPFAVVAVRDSYYKLPFEKDFDPDTGYMNVDDPNPPGRHPPKGQAYAFDLGAPEGTPVLAARSGVVKLMEDDDPYNAADAPKDWEKIGNFIWIRHRDGTFAVYFHNKEDTAKVTVGQSVRRGQHLADTGETGQASGPHVHFGLFTKKSLDFSVFTDVVPNVRARFEARRGANNDLVGCYIPRNGQGFISTNALPLGD